MWRQLAFKLGRPSGGRQRAEFHSGPRVKAAVAGAGGGAWAVKEGSWGCQCAMRLGARWAAAEKSLVEVDRRLKADIR